MAGLYTALLLACGLVLTKSAYVSIQYADPANNNASAFDWKYARFGTKGSQQGITADQVIHVETVEGGENHGCTAHANAPDGAKPWIALIKRGNCKFTVKINTATHGHNASAVVIYNNDGNDTVYMSHDSNHAIAVFIGQHFGETIADLVDKGVKVKLTIGVRNSPASTPSPPITVPSSTRPSTQSTNPTTPIRPVITTRRTTNRPTTTSTGTSPSPPTPTSTTPPTTRTTTPSTTTTTASPTKSVKTTPAPRVTKTPAPTTSTTTTTPTTTTRTTTPSTTTTTKTTTTPTSPATTFGANVGETKGGKKDKCEGKCSRHMALAIAFGVLFAIIFILLLVFAAYKIRQKDYLNRAVITFKRLKEEGITDLHGTSYA